MLASVPASRLNQFLAVSETPRFSKIYPLQHFPSRQLRHLLVLVEVAFIGVEFTPDAASVFMAIVTSIEVAAMATVTSIMKPGIKNKRIREVSRIEVCRFRGGS